MSTLSLHQSPMKCGWLPYLPSWPQTLHTVSDFLGQTPPVATAKAASAEAPRALAAS